MVQLKSYINDLKIAWIRRLISTNSIYKSLFETIQTSINDLMNKDTAYIDEIQSRSNKFWWDVLEAWKKLYFTIGTKICFRHYGYMYMKQ